MASLTWVRLAKRLNRGLYPLLLVLAIGLGGWLSQHYNHAWDWSDQARNTLSAASQRLLERLEAPLRITSFAPEIPALRSRIREVVGRYQRHRPDITLDFINPSLQPALARELGVQVSGELHLNYLDRSETLRSLDEESLSNAIQRLLQRGERWVITLSGHGERRLDGQANHDLGNFGEAVRKKGYRIQEHDLAKDPAIPENTSLLVLADPQTAYLPGELALISGYLAQGGNLLWLTDASSDPILTELAERVGVTRLPGTLVDASGSELGLESPGFALVSDYPDHPVTAELRLLTLFPGAAALEVQERVDWFATPLLTTQARSWNETGPIAGEITRDAELGERPGPLHLGVGLVRVQEQGEQRLIILGDADFLSNSFLGNGGNLQLGLNLVRWLARDDRLLQLPARTAKDRRLELSPRAGAMIGLGMLLVLPLTFFTIASLVWWRRRR